MIMPDFSPKKWLLTVKEMEKLDWRTVLFPHSAHFGPRSAEAEQRPCMENLYSAVGKAIKSGINPFQTSYYIQLPKFEKRAFYKQWHPGNAERIVVEGHMGW